MALNTTRMTDAEKNELIESLAAELVEYREKAEEWVIERANLGQRIRRKTANEARMAHVIEQQAAHIESLERLMANMGNELDERDFDAAVVANTLQETVRGGQLLSEDRNKRAL
jgi:phosphopantetheine adenylyltransferase